MPQSAIKDPEHAFIGSLRVIIETIFQLFAANFSQPSGIARQSAINFLVL
jgi:hypothetical protein